MDGIGRDLTEGLRKPVKGSASMELYFRGTSVLLLPCNITFVRATNMKSSAVCRTVKDAFWKCVL